MKYVDKLLKILKTDRNTFFTYIFSLLSAYIAVDRLVEMLFIIFTGVSVSYWGPITYTFALACPVLAFFFSGSSKYAEGGDFKIIMVYLYAIALYIIGISMFVQWLNMLLWVLLVSVPNYVEIATQFTSLIKPAFQAIGLYIPITTFFSIIWWCYAGVADSRLIKESIWDYTGINLSKKSVPTGAYSFENIITIDKETGKKVKICDNRRADPVLICGSSGTGKNLLALEPMMARDMEKKYFFKEAAKEMGFTALKTGLANLRCPYSNEYINANFSLNMIEPIEGKEKLYKAYLSKIIYCESPKIVYKDLGITYVTPDYESVRRMVDIANNFNLKVNLVDPTDPNSIGINPFAYGAPSEIATVISSIITATYAASRPEEDEAFFQNSAAQAVENISILLSVMFSRLNEGELPTLEDMLDLLNDFDLAEAMCRRLEQDEELAKEYRLQIGYFKKYFYRDAPMRENTERYVHMAITQIDSLLRIDGVKNILCNRTNNINFDEALANGEITIVCTRRGELGSTMQKAFGLFFLLSMQHAVLTRPGGETSRIPHLLYVDEFPEFLCSETLSLFTLYRKYKVGTIITTQNLKQLAATETSQRTILANSSTKIVFGNMSAEEGQMWVNEFGSRRMWKYSQDMKITAEGSGNQLLMGNSTAKDVSYGDYKGVSWSYVDYFTLGKFQGLKFKDIGFVCLQDNGKRLVGQAKLDFMPSQYKEAHKEKQFNFSKFQDGISNEEEKRDKNRFDPKTIDFDTMGQDHEIDPIQSDDGDINFVFNNEDAIIYDMNRDKKKKN